MFEDEIINQLRELGIVERDDVRSLNELLAEYAEVRWYVAEWLVAMLRSAPTQIQNKFSAGMNEIFNTGEDHE